MPSAPPARPAPRRSTAPPPCSPSWSSPAEPRHLHRARRGHRAGQVAPPRGCCTPSSATGWCSATAAARSGPARCFAVYAGAAEPMPTSSRWPAPRLERLGEPTGETVNLAVPRGDGVEQIAQVDSRYLLGATQLGRASTSRRTARRWARCSRLRRGSRSRRGRARAPHADARSPRRGRARARPAPTSAAAATPSPTTSSSPGSSRSPPPSATTTAPWSRRCRSPGPPARIPAGRLAARRRHSSPRGRKRCPPSSGYPPTRSRKAGAA